MNNYNDDDDDDDGGSNTKSCNALHCTFLNSGYQSKE